MIFYIIALMLLAVPGIGLGILLTILELVPGITGALLGILAGNIPIALVVFFLCRNLLQYVELNGK